MLRFVFSDKFLHRFQQIGADKGFLDKIGSLGIWLRGEAQGYGLYIDAYNPAYAIKMSGRNFSFENGIKTVPLYAAFCV